jgi:hypothetical protein
MIRYLLVAAVMLLSACASTPPVQVQPVPIACPPSMKQPIKDQPKRPADLDAYDMADNPVAVLLSEHARELGVWGRDGWARATTSKTYCEGVR